MILVKLFHGCLEVRALLALDEQLSNLVTTRHVLWTDFSHFALLGGVAVAVAVAATARAGLGLYVRRTEGVIGELSLVLGLGDLGFAVPKLTFLVWHVLPGEPDDLRERTVVCLNLRRDVPTFDE